MTAGYLINRLPTPILSHKSPHEILFQELPDYKILRIFGCLEFITNPSTSSDKFDHRGVPCVFVGYPMFQKWYKLYNLITNKHFVSRDVHFNGSVFPFHSNDTSKFMTPIPPSYNPTFLEDSDILSLKGEETSKTSPQPQTPVLTHSTSDSAELAEETPPPAPRKSSRPHRPSLWMNDFVTANSASTISTLVNTDISSTFHCFLSTLTTTVDPVSFKNVVQNQSGYVL